MTIQKRIEALQQALRHLSEAENILRKAGSPVLKAYVADPLDVKNTKRGKGMCGLIHCEIEDLKERMKTEI